MAGIGKVFVLDSTTGQIAKVNSPLLLAGAERPAEYHEISKAVVEGGSKRLRERYGTMVDGVQCVARPFDFHLYAYAATLNTYHARAIRVKVKDIVGRGWKIAGEGPQGLRDQI